MKQNKIKYIIGIILALTLLSCSVRASSVPQYNKYDQYYPYRGSQIYDDYIYRAQMRGYLSTPYCSPTRYNNYRRH